MRKGLLHDCQSVRNVCHIPRVHKWHCSHRIFDQWRELLAVLRKVPPLFSRAVIAHVLAKQIPRGTQRGGCIVDPVLTMRFDKLCHAAQGAQIWDVLAPVARGTAIDRRRPAFHEFPIAHQKNLCAADNAQ